MQRDSKDPDEEGRLIGLAQLPEISAELEEQYKAYLKVLGKLSPDLVSDKRKREDMYNAIVTEALTAKLSTYPTTIGRDQLLLGKSNLSARHHMAVTVRLGEKHLLEEGLSLISRSLDSNTDTSRNYKKVKK